MQAITNIKQMKNIWYALLLGMIVFACETKPSGNMIITGQVDGLKKGTLYLEKVQDSILVVVDSIYVEGSSNFSLGTDVEDAEIYFINLDKNPNYRLRFFGEPGNIVVNTNLDRFDLDAEVQGSKNQEVLDTYNKMAKRFNDSRLDLIQANFEATQAKDQKAMDSLNDRFESLLKRRYFYATNFAIQNADYEVAPYIAVTELYNATNKLLDTINNSLSPEVKTSKYGKGLQDLIDSRNE